MTMSSQRMSVSLTQLDALKEDMKGKAHKRAENKTKAEIENRALEAAVEGAEIDLPECMVDNQVEKMLEDYAYRLKSQGIDMKMYLQYTQMTEDQLKEQMKPSAKQQVLGSLVLEKIAELEKLEATDEDIEKEFDKIAETYKMEKDKIRELMGANIDAMKQDIVTNKALDVLAENAKQTKKKAEKKADKEDGESPRLRRLRQRSRPLKRRALRKKPQPKRHPKRERQRKQTRKNQLNDHKEALKSGKQYERQRRAFR